MRERPILFSGAMVRAILREIDPKTQTRRMVKPQPPTAEAVRARAGIDYDWIAPECAGQPHRVVGPVWAVRELMGREPQLHCPYGERGDRLWGRETWQYADWTGDGYPFIGYEADSSKKLQELIPEDWSERLHNIWALLSKDENYFIDGRAADRRWRPSIHMPRWACRLELDVVDARVERLQDISEADAIAEGCPPKIMDPIRWYRELWEQINGPGSWAANPWVWVITFNRNTSP